MAQKTQPAPVKVTIPNGPTFMLNDMAEFGFTPTDPQFLELQAAYVAARDARDAYLNGKAHAAFVEATGYDLPTGYIIKAGLSRFGGASQGKAWAVIDRAEKPKTAKTGERGFAKWGANG
jgi:hypothetical protein